MRHSPSSKSIGNCSRALVARAACRRRPRASRGCRRRRGPPGRDPGRALGARPRRLLVDVGALASGSRRLAGGLRSGTGGPRWSASGVAVIASRKCWTMSVGDSPGPGAVGQVAAGDLVGGRAVDGRVVDRAALGQRRGSRTAGRRPAAVQPMTRARSACSHHLLRVLGHQRDRALPQHAAGPPRAGSAGTAHPRPVVPRPGASRRAGGCPPARSRARGPCHRWCGPARGRPARTG